MDLFRRARAQIRRFSDDGDPLDLLEAIFKLVHLREWIAPNPKLHPKPPVTVEQKLAAQLYKMSEFKLLLGLCNRSKHWELIHPGPNPATALESESQMGRMKCGDALGQDYFLVEGRDVRDLIASVVAVYLNYFQAQGIAVD